MKTFLQLENIDITQGVTRIIVSFFTRNLYSFLLRLFETLCIEGHSFVKQNNHQFVAIERRIDSLIFYHVITFPNDRLASNVIPIRKFLDGKVGKLEIDPTGVGFKAVCRFVPTARFSFCLVRFPKLWSVGAGVYDLCMPHRVYASK